MRTFIAIELTDAFRRTLAGIRAELIRSGVTGRPIPTQNLHLTLAFTGKHDDPKRILEVLSRLDIKAFDITIGTLGCFGDIYWVGIEGGAPLLECTKAVRGCLNAGGIPFDKKPFKPHITLIRKAKGSLPEKTTANASMRVESISLMSSKRSESGAEYSLIGKIPLK